MGQSSVKINYSNGDRYEGKFKDGKKNGKGIYYHSNGDRYEGEFKDGKENGIGIYYYSNGDIYEGEWKYGLNCFSKYKENYLVTNYQPLNKNKQITTKNKQIINDKQNIIDDLSSSEETMCVICLSNKKRVVFLPCRHDICCISCSKKINECSVCRKKITEKIEHY